MDYETFYDDIKATGKSLRITIPYKMAESKGWKKGDKVKVMIRKED